MELNRNKLMSAYQLSIKTGIPLQTLAPILNSFMFIKLVLRSNGSPNDPNVTFTFNTEWISSNDKISLVNKANLTQSQTNTSNDTLLYIAILNYIQSQSLNKNDVTQEDIYLKFNAYSKNDINAILTKIISTNHVSFSDNKYLYIYQSNNDDSNDEIDEDVISAVTSEIIVN